MTLQDADGFRRCPEIRNCKGPLEDLGCSTDHADNAVPQFGLVGKHFLELVRFVAGTDKYDCSGKSAVAASTAQHRSISHAANYD